MKVKLSVKPLAIVLSLFGATAALADINIGVSVSATGPAAVLGGPQKNTTQLFPTSIAGEKINWIVLDDGSDPTNTSKNVAKFLTESKVDVLITGTTTPGVMAAAGPAADSKTPLIALAPNRLDGEKFKWAFTMPQPIGLMAEPLLEHAKSKGYKTLGFLGYHPDAYGEVWIKALEATAGKYGISFGPIEGFARTDTSVAGQVIKLIGVKPDAVIVVASGSPAAMAHAALAERGYKGQIYQTHGAPSPVFLKNGGKSVENGILVAGPLLEWEQLPDSHPSKKVGGEYAKAYEAKFGKGSLSSFGGHMWDAWAIASRAIPVALKKAKPGTAEFRAALRDAIESEREIAGAHGVFNMSPTDHSGFDGRARVLLQVQNGAFKVVSK
ncbi:ABC transporter substrate-binding protein [Sulfuritalea sp.]|uniref:ABC transporter substrate-binding protein n=1 Tax=Sulfuritalea sp. TaxID=2480090 RepID=UPI00286E452F|nr:ABC transporter substrate-binding protein [Sulfuritalea sp.]